MHTQGVCVFHERKLHLNDM